MYARASSVFKAKTSFSTEMEEFRAGGTSESQSRAASPNPMVQDCMRGIPRPPRAETDFGDTAMPARKRFCDHRGNSVRIQEAADLCPQDTGSSDSSADLRRGKVRTRFRNRPQSWTNVFTGQVPPSLNLSLTASRISLLHNQHRR